MRIQSLIGIFAEAVRPCSLWQWSARRGHLPVVQCLLEAGASVDHAANHGRTILHRTDPQSLKRYHVYHGKLWKGFVVVVGFAQLLLASVEPTAGWLSDERWSNTTTFILELVCLAIFTFDLALNLSFRFMNRKLLVRLSSGVVRCYRRVSLRVLL